MIDLDLSSLRPGLRREARNFLRSNAKFLGLDPSDQKGILKMALHAKVSGNMGELALAAFKGMSAEERRTLVRFPLAQLGESGSQNVRLLALLDGMESMTELAALALLRVLDPWVDEEDYGGDTRAEAAMDVM